jgi:hypothetical protein
VFVRTRRRSSAQMIDGVRQNRVIYPRNLRSTP